MDLPLALPAGDAGFLLPDRVELLGVVGAVADLDPVGVDGPPDRGQQLDVVPGAERDRDVPGGLDQRGVLLVRGERPLRVQRVPEPVVRPVLPDRDEPFVEKVLQLASGTTAAAPPRLRPRRSGAAARIAGGELAEQRADRAENILSMWGLSEPVARCAGWMLMPRCRQEARKLAETNTAPWSITMVSGTITGRAAACSSRSSIAQQPVVGQDRVRHRQAASASPAASAPG